MYLSFLNFSVEIFAFQYETFLSWFLVSVPKTRDIPSIYFWRMSEVLLCAIFLVVLVVDQMALGPVSCPARIHCTAVFALRNGKFSSLGEGMARLHTSLSLVSAKICGIAWKSNVAG